MYRLLTAQQKVDGPRLQALGYVAVRTAVEMTTALCRNTAAVLYDSAPVKLHSLDVACGAEHLCCDVPGAYTAAAVMRHEGGRGIGGNECGGQHCPSVGPERWWCYQ